MWVQIIGNFYNHKKIKRSVELREGKILNIFNIGLKADASEEEKRYVPLTNQIALSFICLASPYFFIFYFLGLPFQAYIVIPSVLSFGVCIALNQFRLHRLASFSVIFATSVIILYYACVLGKAAGAHYVYFALVLMPLMMFPIRCKKWLLASFAVPITFILSMEATHYSIFQTLDLPQHYADIVSFFATITTFSIIVAATFFYHLSRDAAQKRVEEQSFTIKEHADELAKKNTQLEQSEREKDALIEQLDERNMDLELQTSAAVEAKARAEQSEKEKDAALAEQTLLNIRLEEQVKILDQLMKHVQDKAIEAEMHKKTAEGHNSELQEANENNSLLIQELKLKNQTEHLLRTKAEEDIKLIKQQQKELNIVEAGKMVQDKMFSTIPVIEGLTISAFSKACMGVSGDFYWVQKLSDGSVAVFLADVAGKGVPAALNTTLLYRIITHMFKEKSVAFLREPAQVFNALHISLCEEPAFEKGLPAFLGVINVNRLLTYAMAGLGDVYVYRDNQVIYFNPLNGMLHVVDNEGKSETFMSDAFQLKPGDVLYIFTDGYTDTDRRTWKTFIPTDDNHVPNYTLFQAMHTSYNPASGLTRAEHAYTWWKHNIADNIEKLQDDTTVVSVEVE
jgi:serine phosphatase RsbU (regulator of sigma subunit)